jgi:hypothetical protein
MDTPGQLIRRRVAGDPSVTIQQIEDAAQALFAPEARVKDVVYIPLQLLSGVAKHCFKVRFENDALYSVYFEGAAI